MKSHSPNIGSSFFLFLRYESLEDSLKGDVDSFIDRVQLLIPLPEFGRSEESLEDLFRLRIKALKWLVEEEKSVHELVSEAFPFFEEMSRDKYLARVGDSIIFAMESQFGVADHIFSGSSPAGDFDMERLNSSLPVLQTITYQQLKAIGQLAEASEILNTFIRWIESSLNLEYFIFVAAIVKKERIELKQNQIDALSDQIVNAANNFNEIAKQLGMLRTPPHTSALKDFSFKILNVNNPDYKFDRDQANER